MKTLFTLISFLIFTQVGFTQPVISDIIPNFGDEILYKQGENVPSPGASGADVTWDFSDNAVDEYTANYVIAHPSDVEGSDQFPDATMVWVVDLDFLVLNSFLSFTNNAFTNYGSISSGSGQNFGRVYDNPEVHFTYPVNYQDTGSDTYDGNVFGVAGDNPISGESSYSVDGYGTLITPYGTYENVLRITSTKVETLSTLGIESITNITETNWYSPDYPIPVYVLNSSVSMLMGSPTDSSTTATALFSYSAATGVNELKAQNEFDIYPNPSTEKITISSDFKGLGELKIFSVEGKTVKQKSVHNGDKIDLSSLQQGYYIARLMLNGKRYAQRAVVIQ